MTVNDSVKYKIEFVEIVEPLKKYNQEPLGSSQNNATVLLEAN